MSGGLLTCKLKDIATIQSGFAFKSSNFNSEGNGMPLIRIRDILSGETETHYCGEYSSEYVIDNGDLLVGMDGEFNLGVWSGGTALLNQRVCKILPKEDKVCRNYLKHLLPRELKKIEDETPFVTVKHLSTKKLYEITFLLPPLAEQKRIATILDKADAVRQKRQQAIDLLDDLLRSTFLDMFGDPVSNSKGWEMQPMGDVAESVTYGTSEKAEVLPEGVPVLRMGNLTNDGRIDLSDLKYLKASSLSQGKYLLEDGDLLFNRTNSRELVGKTAVWVNKMEMAYAGYLIRVRFKKSVSPHYIAAALNSSQGKAMLYAMAKPAVNMSNISASDFKRIRLSIPPVSLQKEYEKVVKKTQKQRQSLQTFKDEADVLFGALVQQAFNGGLNPQDEVK